MDAAVANRNGAEAHLDAARMARERLTRRLVGLAVLTVAVTAASALLPPRGSAERMAPVPDEHAAGVEVQTVPLNGLGATEPPASSAPAPAPVTAAVASASAPVEPSAPAARTAAEFAQDAPPPPHEVTTLKDHAAEAFDERHLAPPPPLAPAPRPVGVPVARASSIPVARVPPAPVARAPSAPVVVAGGRPSPPAAPRDLEGTGHQEAWVVQVGVFSTRIKADSVARQMRGAGLPAPQIESLQLASGAVRYRVRIPTGGDAVAAHAVRDRVNALPGAFGAAVKSIPAQG